MGRPLFPNRVVSAAPFVFHSFLKSAAGVGRRGRGAKGQRGRGDRGIGVEGKGLFGGEGTGLGDRNEEISDIKQTICSVPLPLCPSTPLPLYPLPSQGLPQRSGARRDSRDLRHLPERRDDLGHPGRSATDGSGISTASNFSLVDLIRRRHSCRCILFYLPRHKPSGFRERCRRTRPRAPAQERTKSLSASSKRIGWARGSGSHSDVHRLG